MTKEIPQNQKMASETHSVTPPEGLSSFIVVEENELLADAFARLRSVNFIHEPIRKIDPIIKRELDTKFTLLDKKLTEYLPSSPDKPDVSQVKYIERIVGKDKREHFLLTTAKDEQGFNHALMVTPPAKAPEHPLTVVLFPGLCEIKEKGIGKEFHAGFAQKMPNTWIISVASDGIGKIGDRIPLLNTHKQSRLDAMTTQRFELLQLLCGDSPVVLVGTSMGAVMAHKLRRLNIQNNLPLKIVDSAYYAPALVDPQKIVPSAVVRFFLETAYGAAKEQLLPFHPWKAVGRLSLLAASRPSISDVPPMIFQFLDLLHGTPEAEIKDVLNGDQSRTTVIVGTHDIVGQWPMWHKLEQESPRLRATAVPGRNHGMVVKPGKAIDKIYKELAETRSIS